MLSVLTRPIMLSVVMLRVVMLCVTTLVITTLSIKGSMVVLSVSIQPNIQNVIMSSAVIPTVQWPCTINIHCGIKSWFE